MASIFVVVGPPAAGKSTTSRALCARFERSVHVPVDDLRMMVVSGRVLPGEEWGEPLARQVRLARYAALDMAERYRQDGFTVVIDDFVDPHRLREYAGGRAQERLCKVVLHPSQEEAHRRNLVRSGDSPDRAYIDDGIRHVYGYLEAALPRLEREGWLVVDTTGLTVEDTVTTILAADPRF